MTNFERNRVNDDNKTDIIRELGRFTGMRDTENKKHFMDGLTADYKFVEDDKRMRNMVEKMLREEFSDDIQNLKSYDLIVDAVINKLKNDAAGNVKDLDNND